MKAFFSQLRFPFPGMPMFVSIGQNQVAQSDKDKQNKQKNKQIKKKTKKKGPEE